MILMNTNIDRFRNVSNFRNLFRDGQRPHCILRVFITSCRVNSTNVLYQCYISLHNVMIINVILIRPSSYSSVTCRPLAHRAPAPLRRVICQVVTAAVGASPSLRLFQQAHPPPPRSPCS